MVNEVAPRPHNSGHFTMDGAEISQFEQLVRAVCGLELIDPNYLRAGYMKNLIGEDILDLSKYKKDKNCKIYDYNKGEVRVGRKMGHVNIIKNNLT